MISRNLEVHPKATSHHALGSRRAWRICRWLWTLAPEKGTSMSWHTILGSQAPWSWSEDWKLRTFNPVVFNLGCTWKSFGTLATAQTHEVRIPRNRFSLSSHERWIQSGGPNCPQQPVPLEAQVCYMQPELGATGLKNQTVNPSQNRLQQVPPPATLAFFILWNGVSHRILPFILQTS